MYAIFTNKRLVKQFVVSNHLSMAQSRNCKDLTLCFSREVSANGLQSNQPTNQSTTQPAKQSTNRSKRHGSQHNLGEALGKTMFLLHIDRFWNVASLLINLLLLSQDQQLRWRIQPEVFHPVSLLCWWVWILVIILKIINSLYTNLKLCGVEARKLARWSGFSHFHNWTIHWAPRLIHPKLGTRKSYWEVKVPSMILTA